MSRKKIDKFDSFIKELEDYFDSIHWSTAGMIVRSRFENFKKSAEKQRIVINEYRER